MKNELKENVSENKFQQILDEIANQIEEIRTEKIYKLAVKREDFYDYLNEPIGDFMSIPKLPHKLIVPRFESELAVRLSEVNLEYLLSKKKLLKQSLEFKVIKKDENNVIENYF